MPGADKLLEADFTVGHKTAIAGWEEGVLGMRPGGVRWLLVPPHLAYGDEGREDAGIAPGAALLFRYFHTRICLCVVCGGNFSYWGIVGCWVYG